MHAFFKKLYTYNDAHRLIQPDDRLLVAVSGGPDSMALLHALRQNGRFGLHVEVAHVDHMLRGEQSREEYEYVEQYCRTRGVPFHGAHIPIAERMEQWGTGLQETARRARYEFLTGIAKKERLTLVLGHHADDQIETILFRMIRGSTGLARAGIQPVRTESGVRMIRPLLSHTKEEILRFCHDEKVEFCIDPSNEKPDYTRNRIRQQLLPVIKEENPKAHEQFLRWSEEWTEDEEWLQREADDRLPGVTLEKTERAFELCRDRFLNEGRPLQRRMIHLILKYLYVKVPTSLSSAHVKAILSLCHQVHPSGEADLPDGLRVIRSYDRVQFVFHPDRTSTFHIPLQEGVPHRLPSGAVMQLQRWSPGQEPGAVDTIHFDAAAVKWPLVVRNRKPGDRIRLKGMNGSKKVKDLFMDEKIPHAQRDEWPIVTDANGEIVWIPRLRVAGHLSCEQIHTQGFTILYYEDFLGGHVTC